MTIPPLRAPLTYWTIAIVHDDNFNGWPVKSWPSEVFVSIKGRPVVRQRAEFRCEDDAQKFLDFNREVLDHRCAGKFGFRTFRISSGTSLWPITYDEPVQLKRPGCLSRTGDSERMLKARGTALDV